MTTSTLLKTSLMTVAGTALFAVGTVSSASAANLVTNGGFETGNFSSWTQSGNLSFTGVDTFSSNSGNFGASLGPVGSLGYLSQTLATVVGQTYELSYFLKSDGGIPNKFQTLIKDATGNIDALFTKRNIPSQLYTKYSFDFIGTGSDTLQFGFQNNPGYLGLDDVSVIGPSATAVPTPALLPGLIGLGVAALRKRKAEAAKQTSEV